MRQTLKTSKHAISVLILALTVTIAFTIAALPITTAQTGTMKTYAFINALPNPAGVGQEVLLHIGITHPLSLQPEGWEGLTVTVTKPDNTTQTLGPYRTDSTGGTGSVFVPDQVGTYYLQTHFPEQKIPTTASPGGSTGIATATPANTTMLASDSPILALIVQQNPVPIHPGYPLPTEYWSRPIDSQLREWSHIGGSWLIPQNWFTPRNFAAPDNQGPESPHILWTKQYTHGGLIGGALGDIIYNSTEFGHPFDIGDAYEGKWNNALIVAGIGYFKAMESSVTTTGVPYTAVNLRTGEELWTKTFLDNRTIARGQLLFWDTYDFQGVYDYLIVTIGSTWYFFDSYTGNLHYTLTNVPSGNIVHGPKGEILIYTTNLAQRWMTLWNSTNIPELYASTDPGSMGWGQWRPFGKTINATGPVSGPGPNNPLRLTGYQWNVTLPAGLTGSVQEILDDRIIGSSLPTYTGTASGRGATNVTFWGISLQPGTIGQLLFANTWQAPSEWASGGVVVWVQGLTRYGKDGVIVVAARELTKFYGFSTNNGDFLWETDPQDSLDTDAYLNWYGIPRERPVTITDDKLISTGIGGLVYAYDIKTGELLWEYKAVDPYSEILFGNNWWLFPLFVTDGKIYLGHVEHSPNNPRPRGAPFISLDLENGTEVFRSNGLFRQSLWGGRAIIGDSVILTQDTYDQRVYAVGKGPSAITVEAPSAGLAMGSSVVIRGRVTDVSPGTKGADLTLRFPNGVPAVSDASMSDWMLYVYKQFPRPTNVTGVEVTLAVVDANNNSREIGRTTSDVNGFFTFNWKPDIEGQYTVYASFAGSKSYWPSYTETSFAIDPAAAAPAPTQTTQTQSIADLYFVPAIIGLFIAIIVVGLMIILVLRKRP
jgi:hypothetical protein